MDSNCYDSSFLKLRHPFNAIVVGPSGTGKTVLVRRLIAQYRCVTNITAPSIKVLWAYSVPESLRPIETASVSVEFYQGLPSEAVLRQKKPNILVLDDLQFDVSDNEKAASIFTKLSHHLSMSVFYIVHNFFLKSKMARTIAVNLHYVIFMRNPRDVSQIKHFASQLGFSDQKHFLSAYKKATDHNWSYFVVDLRPDTPEPLRMRSRLTSEELTREEKKKYKFAPFVYP